MSLPDRPVALSRRQRLWLAAAITLAAALRFAGMEHLSISHFDEGSYISSAMTVATEGAYSFPFGQPLQSPPLLPWMIGAIIWLTQAQWPILGALVSAALGTASVPMFFLVARRWEGNHFGLWGATLLAVSDFHVAYSRMVLTDVPLTFWFLLTMYFVTRLWQRAEAATSAETASPKKEKLKKARSIAKSLARQSMVETVGWGLAAGLSAAAAWNTKYNGWLVLAIAAFAAGLWLSRSWLAKLWPALSVSHPSTNSGMLALGLFVAASIAAVSFVPWCLYVEHHFPGGYAAVTANHRRYFYSPISWPHHAQSLISSLAALRHYGWIATLAIVVVLGVRLVTTLKPNSRGDSAFYLKLAPKLAFTLGLIGVVLVQGGDAALILLGTAGIVAALISPSWPRLLAAVWCGTFVVLTPLYHPYPRLMLPALPACICLLLWLLKDAWPGLTRERKIEPKPADTKVYFNCRTLAGVSFAAAGIMAFVWLMGPHPYGLASPSQGIWNRWSARNSYRAAGQAILEHTHEDAVIICQTQLAMISYCPRLPLVAEDHSFLSLIEGIPQERDCYLLVDFSWIHGQPDSAALKGIVDNAHNLTAVAVIPNDLSIITLLDMLTPNETAAKVAGNLPRYRIGPPSSIPLPPPLAAPFEDVIVLYRIKLPRTR
ncbi:MAG: ArnT family glycosyltransferase [Pirellulaceae bacterium]